MSNEEKNASLSKALKEQEIAIKEQEIELKEQEIAKAEMQEQSKIMEQKQRENDEFHLAQKEAIRAKEIRDKQDKKKNNQQYYYNDNQYYDDQYYDDSYSNQYYNDGYNNQYYDDGYYNKRRRFSKIMSRIILFVLAAVIFFTSYIGLKSVEECNDKYDNDSDRELVERSNFAYITSMGLSCGIIFYLLLNRSVGKFPIIFFGITLLALGIIYVISYEDLKKTSNECYKKSKYQFRISYGLIGAGAGIVFFSLVDKVLSTISRPAFSSRIIMVLMSIFCVGVGILNILINNSCNDKSKGNEGTGKYFYISVGILSLSSLILIGTLVSFYFMRP